MGHGAQEGEDNTENCHKAAEMVIAEKQCHYEGNKWSKVLKH